MAQTSVTLSLNGDRQTLVAGNAARARGDWSAAAAYYDRYLRARPNHFAIWVQLGHALKEAGQRVDSLIAYSRALALDDTDADLLLNLGHLHKLMGHRDLAIHYYQRSAEVDSNVHAVNELRRLGLASDVVEAPALSKQRSHTTPAPLPRTMARLRALARRKSRRILSLANQARDRLDWPTAAQQYRLYLKERPEDFAIWVQLGHALKESGQLDQALGAYGQAVSINPMDADLLLNLGHLHKLMGHQKTAINYYKRSADLDQQAGVLEELDRLEQADQPPRPAEHHPRVPTPIEQRRQATILDIERRLFEPLPPARIDGPLISILTPVYNIGERWLRRMAASVLRQSYQRWELILVDDGSPNVHVREVMTDLAASDPRIIIHFRERNGGISAATNDALRLARGEYVALLDNDDMLTSDALEEMAGAIIKFSGPDWLYSDEFKIGEDDRASDPFAKPDWSPFMLLNYMYTGHLTLYKTAIVEKVGGFRSEYDFSQDYDLALRISEVSPRVVHVEKYLYGWRMIPGSAAQGDKPDARRSNIAALQDAADRRGWEGQAVPLPTANRVLRPNAGNGAKISIIIPSDNGSNIANAISSIINNTSYSKYEIIVVTNSSLIKTLSSQTRDHRIVWIAYDKPFNFSDKCNVGAAAASCEYIVFFNDDVRVLSNDWIECILEYITLPGVGIVGLKLLYENGTIQHAGMVTGVRRLLGTAFHCLPRDTTDQACMAQCVRDVSLICGALLAIPLKLFRELNGFDAINTPVYHSDVDLCLRTRESGYSCVYSPHATMLHIGHASLAEEDHKAAQRVKRDKDKADIYCLRQFGGYIERDPYFPPAMRDLVYYDSQEPFSCFSGGKSNSNKDALLVTHDLTASGAPKLVYDIAIKLKTDGYYVVVISPTDGPFRKKLQDQGITVIIDSLILTANDASMALTLNFDLVIVNTIVGWRVVNALKDITNIYWYTHETELVHHFISIYPEFEILIQSNPNIWSGSERAAAAIRRYGGTPLVLEYGTDDIAAAIAPTPSAAPHDNSHRPIKIAVFGSYEPRKGQDLAALAMEFLPPDVRARARLSCYGRTLDTEFRKAVIAIAKRVEKIDIFGELTFEEYREQLSSADIVLVPSRDDTLPLVSLDALALGKPLICTAATGTSAYFTHGVSGVTLNHGDPQEIALELSQLIEDEEYRARIGRNGRFVFEEHFTYAAFERRLSEALAEFNRPPTESAL